MGVVRRWAVWAVVVVVVVTALTIGATRRGPVSLEARARALAEQVRCPVCQGESAQQSQVPAAQQIRQQIRAELAAGSSAPTVLHDLELSYGATILERPPASGVGLVVWLLPVALALLGVAGLAAAFARWRRPLRGAGTGASVSSEDAELVARARGERR